MTDQLQAEVGAPMRSGLRRLLDLPVEDFAAQHWGRTPRYIPAADLAAHDAGGLTDLLTLDDVDDLLSSRGLRAPFLRVAKDGRTRPDADFTRGGGIGAGVTDQLDDTALLRLFAEGSTLVLQGLHRTHPPLLTFSQQLAADLGHPVQVNAYITPAQSTGFSAHYDVHDVFVLQVAGEKSWRIYAPVLTDPLRDQPWDARRDEVAARAEEAPHLDLTMQPGDVLYLPRGWLHAATAKGEVSGHITVGVQAWHRGHVAESALAAVRRMLTHEEDQRRSLPLGIDLFDADQLAGEIDAVRAALIDALQQLSPEAVAADLGARHRAAQRPAPVRPVATTTAARHLDEDEVVSLRPHQLARVVPLEHGPTLIGRSGRVLLEDEQVAAVEDLLRDGVAPVRSLGVELTRRLLLAGVVLPPGGPA